MANTAYSDYLEEKIASHLFRTNSWSKIGTIYFALLTSAPSDSGGGTEVISGNYTRVAITPLDTNFSVTGNTATNLVPITFSTPNAAWGVITHIAAYDAASGGNLLFWDELTTPKTVGASDPAPSWPAGAFIFIYNSTSTELATQILSFIFKTLATWTKPTSLIFDLYTAAPTVAGGGTKVTGGSYAAQSITPLDANFPITVNGTNGTTSVTNANAITYPSPTVNWGTINALGISTNTGFFVSWQALSAKNINAGDIAPSIAASNLVWAVN